MFISEENEFSLDTSVMTQCAPGSKKLGNRNSSAMIAMQA